MKIQAGFSKKQHLFCSDPAKFRFPVLDGRLSGYYYKTKGVNNMKQQYDVYLFGQILGTHSFLLRDGFLQPDEYAEIADQYFLPGG